MNFADFFAEAKEKNITFKCNNTAAPITHRISNEALFHIPLLAITILQLSSSRAKPKSDELGQLVGECFERTFRGFKGSSQHLGWSANLRMRTVKALTFLEMANLIEVNAIKSTIGITPTGRKLLNKAFSEETDLTYTLEIIKQNYNDIRAEKQIAMGLS